MGLLNDLFKSNSQAMDTNTKKLVDCVTKVDDGTHGVFVSIMNDLENYTNSVEDNDSNARKMAYAYARRISAAGLCAQGIWGKDEYDYIMNIFLSYQISTEQSVEFQEEAGEQAFELVQSYDSRLVKDLLVALMEIISEDPSKTKKADMILEYENLINSFYAN